MDGTTQGRPAEQEPTRVCQRCSVQSTVAGTHCPNCGKPFVGRVGPSRKVIGLSLLALLVVVGLVGGGLTWKNHRDEVASERRAAAAAKQAAAEEAAEQAALEEAEAEVAAAEEAERAARKDAIKQLRRNMTKHAKELVGEGLLDGPILYTSCTATGGGSADDLTALTGTFDCIAVNEEKDDGRVSGYGYTGTIDWDSGQMSWQLGD